MSVAWLIIFVAILLIGLTKSGFGSGTGLMIVPMTAIALDHLRPDGSKDALGLLLPLLLIGDLIAVFQYRRLFSLNIVKHLLPGTLLGVVIGSLGLFWFKQQQELAAAFIKIEIGLESVGLVGLSWYRTRIVRKHETVPALFKPTKTHNFFIGAICGISSTLAHAAGPIIALYLLPQGLDRQLFVGTCAIYFLLLNTAKVPGYIAAGEFHLSLLHQSAMLLPLLVIGALVGFWLNKRMSDKFFTRFVYGVTFCLGCYILFDGVRLFLSRR